MIIFVMQTLILKINNFYSNKCLEIDKLNKFISKYATNINKITHYCNILNSINYMSF